MARLPQVRPSGITANPRQASASAIEGEAAAGAFGVIGGVAGQERERLEPLMDQRAEEQASNRLADYDEARETGVPPGEIALRRELTRQDQIYNRTVEAGVTSRLILDAEEQARRLDREHEYDAAGYSESADAFMEAALTDIPLPIAQRASLAMRQRFERGAGVVSDRVRAREVQETRDTLVRSLDSFRAQRESLVQLNGPSAQSMTEWAEIVEQEDAVLAELADNPAYGVSEGFVEEYGRLRANATTAGLLRHEVLLRYEQDGRVAALEGVPDLVANVPNLSDEDRQSLERSLVGAINTRAAGNEARRIETERAEARARAEAARAQALAFNEMRVQMALGNLTADAIDQRYQDGQIDDGQWSALMVAQIGMERAAAEEADERAWLLGSSALDPTNSDHRNAVDAQFRELMRQAGVTGESFGAAPLEYTSDIIAMADQFGVVPETGATALRAFAVNGTPEQQSTALDAIAAINEARPAAALQAFSERLVGDAAMYSGLAQSGLDPASAFEHVAAVRERRANLNPAGQELLRQEAREIAADIDWNTLRHAFDTTPILPGGIPSLPGGGVEQNLVAEARTLFTNFYQQHADENMALRQTREVLRRSWGRTDVTGGNRIMRYPPERFYDVPGRSTTWMRQQLTGAVAEVAGGDVRAEDIGLVADATTAREAQNGVPPSYLVTYIDPNGLYATIPGRWRFDVEEQIAEADRAARANIDVLRQSREDYIAGLDERADELALNAYEERMWMDSSGWMNSDEVAEMERLREVVRDRRRNPPGSIIDRTAAEE